MEHATKGKKHAEKVALRRYLHNIKLKIMLNVYELLFVCVGNETFAHWRQLPSSLLAGVCDYDQFWSLAGRVAQSAEAMPNFSFCYVTSRKNQLFCAPILYIYINIKLYNTTIFSRLLPICVCFRGPAPDPAGGAYHTPSWESCASRKKCHLFFFPPMTCLVVWSTGMYHKLTVYVKGRYQTKLFPSCCFGDKYHK